MKGFGRRYAPDVRDQRCLMCDKLPRRMAVRPMRKTWRIWWQGNQGQTNQCVGFSWHALLRSLPNLQREPSPEEIYYAAQKLDEWEGENYEGSSVRGGAKALQAAGKLKAYGWAFDLETLLNWLAFKGPVVLGTDWLQRMMTPNAEGIVTVSGKVIGGHAYEAIGFDDARELVYCQNSWSKTWGKKGRFYVRYADLTRLIEADGEVCTATE